MLKLLKRINAPERLFDHKQTIAHAVIFRISSTATQTIEEQKKTPVMLLGNYHAPQDTHHNRRIHRAMKKVFAMFPNPTNPAYPRT